MGSQSHTKDAFSTILERARRGDAAAMATLYERHAKRVLAIVRRRLTPALRAKYDTMDLAHSVFLEVMRELPRLEDRGEQAFAKLLAIKAESKVRSKMRRHLGREGRRAEAPLPEHGLVAADTDATSAATGADEREKLRRAMKSLDETTRAVLHQHSQGRTFAEIAAALSLTNAAAARKRHSRALARLRRRWDG